MLMLFTLFFLAALNIVSVFTVSSDIVQQSTNTNSDLSPNSSVQKDDLEAIQASYTLLMMANQHFKAKIDSPISKLEQRRLRNRINKRASRARMSKEEKLAMYKKERGYRKKKHEKSKEAAQKYKEGLNASSRRYRARRASEKKGEEINPEYAKRLPQKKLQPR